MDAKEAKFLRVARLREARNRLGICHAAQGGPVVAHVVDIGEPFYFMPRKARSPSCSRPAPTERAPHWPPLPNPGPAICLAADVELEEMGVLPTRRRLDHAVQVFERYLSGDLDPAPDRRLGIFERS